MTRFGHSHVVPVSERGRIFDVTVVLPPQLPSACSREGVNCTNLPLAG